LRVLGYVSKHPDIEKDIRKVTQSPTQAFTPEQQQFLAKNKFEKSDAGEEWTTQAPYENKKGQTVQNQYTIKFHTNGMFSAEDTIDADVKVFDDWDEIEGWVMNNQSNFVQPQPGLSHYQPTKQMSPKEQYLQGKTKIKLDASKETELLDKCKMAWRPSNHYYKAYLPGNDRFQFFAFSDGTYMGCVKSTKDVGPTLNNWTDALNYCKHQTANALPNEDYTEGKAWIGVQIGGTPKLATPSQAIPTPPFVGSVPATEYTLSPVEINTFQIIANQHGGVTVVPNVAGEEGMTMFVIPKLSPSSNVPIGNFNVLAVGKKAISPTGKKYTVEHAVFGQPKEEWSFANWNQTLAFVKNNFSMLTQADTAVKDTVSQTSTFSPFIPPSNVPLPPPSNSKAVYTAHLGLNKPPANTIRLTQEDEDLMKSLGFEPQMVGSDVYYIHKTIGDLVKFFPNDVAKILLIKTNNKGTITKKIGDALEWLQSKYLGATQSPIVTTPPTAAAGAKAGAMYEKFLTDKGFQWDAATGKYFQTGGEMGHADTIKIAPFPKSTFTDETTGEKKTFGSLPALANFLKGYDSLKKKY
jgi:hypothetical protein